MPSLLSYPTTEGFRKTLIAKNLKPYTVPGVYTPNVNNVTYEVELGDLSVVDSPDELIAKDPYADILYPLNAYGPLGGYIKDLNVGNLEGTKSNLGPPTSTGYGVVFRFINCTNEPSILASKLLTPLDKFVFLFSAAVIKQIQFFPR